MPRAPLMRAIGKSGTQMLLLSLVRIDSIWSCRAARRPERAIQKAVFAHIPARGAKGLVDYPAGGYRRPAEAKILVGLG
jgi:hypothetical protein